MADRLAKLVFLVRGWLLNPHPRISDPEKIQRSRLLSIILLVLIVLGAAILSIVIRQDPKDIYEPEVQGALIVLAIVTGMYILNRMGYNRYAAAGVILPFILVFTDIGFSSSGKAVFLAFLLIPILMTAIFFSLRWTSIVSASILVALLILLASQDQVSPTSPFWTLRSIWFLLVLATGLLITFMWHLGNLEQIRQHELMRINHDLEEKVAELERFSYTVSHELKTPIVTIKAFTGSVEKDLLAGKIEQVRNDLIRISKAADNMHATLTDLLTLSRAGQLVDAPSEFSLAELVHEAAEAARGTIESHHIRLNVELDLPRIYADRKRLREVFENLIDNAAKYMGDQPHPLIEIGMRRGKESVFFVRDNGIGIEPPYHQKIFGLFDKLDSTTEGTGVGLALVKRIIETHGGRVWVESEGSGKGTTFCFTIPSHKQEIKTKVSQAQ